MERYVPGDIVSVRESIAVGVAIRGSGTMVGLVCRNRLRDTAQLRPRRDIVYQWRFDSESGGVRPNTANGRTLTQRGAFLPYHGSGELCASAGAASGRMDRPSDVPVRLWHFRAECTTDIVGV